MNRSPLDHEFGELLGHWSRKFPYNCVFNREVLNPKSKIGYTAEKQALVFNVKVKNDYKTAICDCKILYTTANSQAFSCLVLKGTHFRGLFT